MALPRFLLCSFLLLSCSLLLAQTPILKGQWVGQLKQNEGGFRSNYNFEIYIWEAAGEIKGRSYVQVEEIEGILNFNGQKNGQILYLMENKILFSQKPDDLSWCLKTMQLRLILKDGVWHLEGPWQGASENGPCIPGWIVLKKISPRA